MTATIYIVDDDPGALASMTWLVEQEGMHAAAFASAREFLESYSPGSPGCLLLDVCMPELSGTGLQQELAQRGIDLPIVFVTAQGDVPSCVLAFKAGACDYLEKPVPPDVLLDRIRGALLDDARRRGWPRTAVVDERLAKLTVRERQVLDGILESKSLKQLAMALGVSVQTVWKHRLTMLRKLGARGDVELALLMAAAGKGPPAASEMLDAT